jgi:hypothetical protein
MSSDAGLVRYMPGPPNRMDTQVASSTVSFLGIAVWPIRFLFDRWAGPFGLSAFTDVNSLSGPRSKPRPCCNVDWREMAWSLEAARTLAKEDQVAVSSGAP